MPNSLQSSVVVVFGGASGIGRGIAAAFLQEGAKVAVVDRASSNDLGALHCQADVTEVKQVQEAIDHISTELGPVDHAVFAVGMGSGQFGIPFWQVGLDVWDRVLKVNLTAAAVVAQALVPTFTTRRSGTLLFLSSVAGQIGSQTDPPYSAAKAGLLNFAEVCAKDFAPYGVRVNTICPGMIQTPLNRSVWQAWHDRQPVESQLSYEEWTSEKISRTVPLGRWQTVEDVAAVAVFLASEKAKNITGQTINVDGGQVMHW
jgi:2-hydroxycyclohexanecarboxyl-CoA dehydrogenase